ncbi:MAG: acyltransferase, partial [Candidatus Neomarinimicrobiota bacterium]
YYQTKITGLDMSNSNKLFDKIHKYRRTFLFLYDPRSSSKRVKSLKKMGVVIGENVTIRHGTIFDMSRPFLIEIGNNVRIAPNCHFFTHDASMNYHLNKTLIGKIRILDNSFIGAKSLVLPNVTIGPNSIIGAGSVVTKSIPEQTVFAGNPAKFICSLDDFLHKHKSFSKNHPHYSYYKFHGDWISEANKTKMARELDSTFGYSTRT